MAESKRHAVTVLLTDDHLRKMIDDHLLKEEDIGDRVKVARIVQKLLNDALDLPDKPWHDWDDGFLGCRTRGTEIGLSRTEVADLCGIYCNTQIVRPRLARIADVLEAWEATKLKETCCELDNRVRSRNS